MKKVVLTFFLALTLGFSAQAQSTFGKGTGVVNFGIGLGGDMFYDSYSILLPPLTLSADFSIVGGLFDGNGSLGIGGFFGTAASRYRSSKYYRGGLFSRTEFGPRVSLHYEFIPRLDTYVTQMLGMGIAHESYDSSVNGTRYAVHKRTWPYFAYGTHAGVRYYLSNSWAIYSELGYGITYWSFGATYKF